MATGASAGAYGVSTASVQISRKHKYMRTCGAWLTGGISTCKLGRMTCLLVQERICMSCSSCCASFPMPTEHFLNCELSGGRLFTSIAVLCEQRRAAGGAAWRKPAYCSWCCVPTRYPHVAHGRHELSMRFRHPYDTCNMKGNEKQHTGRDLVHLALLPLSCATWANGISDTGFRHRYASALYLIYR